MNIYKEIIYRIRAGESERSIARDMGISRPTIHKYKIKAEVEGYLDKGQELPGSEELAESLGPASQPPKNPSTLENYREMVQKYLDQGLQMTVIYQRMRENCGYEGSYSSVRLLCSTCGSCAAINILTSSTWVRISASSSTRWYGMTSCTSPRCWRASRGWPATPVWRKCARSCGPKLTRRAGTRSSPPGRCGRGRISVKRKTHRVRSPFR